MTRIFLVVSIHKMALEEHHKFGYLTREVPKPRPGSPQERIWKEENSLLRFVLTVCNLKLGNPYHMPLLLGTYEIQFRSYTQRGRMHLAFILCVSKFTSASKG